MIKSLVIENFKAIKRLELTFTPLTVLIGDNSCGKSTVLQALDFIRGFATRDIDEYLQHERGWFFEDIKSQFSNRGVSFSIELMLNINGITQNISWSIAVDVDSKTGEFVIGEVIRNNSKGKTVLARGVDEKSTPDKIENLLLKSSYLKLFNENEISTLSESPEEWYAVKKFFTQSSSYELLTPDRMREKGSRGEVKDIGMGGEKLAAYINSMSATQKSKLNWLNYSKDEILDLMNPQSSLSQELCPIL